MALTVLANASLALTVLACWLGCGGFARLRDATDRMHCVGFVNAAGGVLLLLYCLLQDGVSVRTGKVGLLVATAVVCGAALSHATGRVAVFRRRDNQ